MELREPKPFEIFESEADSNTIFIKKGNQIYARVSKADYETDRQARLAANMISKIPLFRYEIKKLMQDYDDIFFICQLMEKKLQDKNNQNDDNQQ